MTKHFSTQLEVGYGVMESNNSPKLLKPAGWKTNVEARYYPGKNHRIFYVGANAFYNFLRDNWGVAYHPGYDKNIKIVDDFSVSKNVYGMRLVAGLQFIKHRFVFNPFIGGGIMYQDITNSYREYSPDAGDEHVGFHHPVSYWKLESYLSETSGFQGCFTVGVRLGYAFGKNN